MNLFDLVSQNARENPGSLAVRCQGTEISWEKLHARALALSQKIRQLSSSEVILYSERHANTYVGLYASLAAGLPYVPLNPKLPFGRQNEIIEILKSKLMLIPSEQASENLLMLLKESQGLHCLTFFPHLNEELAEKFSQHRFECFSEPNLQVGEAVEGPQTAYIIFTSGSTGKPKGVRVSHKNVRAFLENMSECCGPFEKLSRFSQIADLSFDMSVHDVYLALYHCGSLVVLPDDRLFSPFDFCREFEVNYWMSVPSLIKVAKKLNLLEPGQMPSLRKTFFCGEPLYLEDLEYWMKNNPNSEVYNVYGPTEATVAMTYYPCHRGQSKHLNGIVSIGKPFPSESCVLKDIDSNQVGELILEGKQVAEGYYTEALNAQAFEVIDAQGNKAYLTRDLVKLDEDLDLFFLGRSDSQVKIQGYRVELGEIEHKFKEVSGADFAVCCFEGGKLFLMSQFDEENLNEILNELKKRLPHYMVPGRVINVREPLYNLNAKIDRKKMFQDYCK